MQKTAYEMRISDWSSDVCSSDLSAASTDRPAPKKGAGGWLPRPLSESPSGLVGRFFRRGRFDLGGRMGRRRRIARHLADGGGELLGRIARRQARDRKSVVEGKSVSVRVDLGGSRIIKKKKK